MKKMISKKEWFVVVLGAEEGPLLYQDAYRIGVLNGSIHVPFKK